MPKNSAILVEFFFLLKDYCILLIQMYCMYYVFTRNYKTMIANTDLIQQLERRYATKQFDTEKKIPEDDLNTLLESLRLSPSSFGLQGRWFVVVESSDLRAQLRPHSRDQAQVTDASHLIVLCRSLDMWEEQIQLFINKIAEIREIPADSLDGYKGMMNGFVEGMSDQEITHRLTKQVYLALWFLLSSCAHLQIDACPLEWFDSKKYDEILWLEQERLSSCVVVPVGYRHADDAHAALAKVRFDKQKVIIRK